MLVPDWLDHVGRLENLAATIETVKDATGRELVIPKVWSSRRKPGYESYYSDYTRKIVEKVYTEDLERFGYQF